MVVRIRTMILVALRSFEFSVVGEGTGTQHTVNRPVTMMRRRMLLEKEVWATLAARDHRQRRRRSLCTIPAIGVDDSVEDPSQGHPVRSTQHPSYGLQRLPRRLEVSAECLGRKKALLSIALHPFRKVATPILLPSNCRYEAPLSQITLS